VFFDYKTDILYFSRFAGDSQKNLFLRKVKPAELAKVQNFAAAGWDVYNIGSFLGLKKLIFLCPDRTWGRLALGAHNCGVARGDVGIHEMEDLVARYPDQQHSLKEALLSGKISYQNTSAFCKQWQYWPNGFTVVYAMSCDNGVQRPSYVV
jgi:hypothetical protein